MQEFQLSWFEVYLWTRLDLIGGAILLCTFLATVTQFIMFCLAMDETPADPKRWRCVAKRVCAVGFVAALLWLTIPSKSDAALIYILPKLSKSEVLQRDVPELYSVAMDALKRLGDEAKK